MQKIEKIAIYIIEAVIGDDGLKRLVEMAKISRLGDRIANVRLEIESLGGFVTQGQIKEACLEACLHDPMAGVEYLVREEVLDGIEDTAALEAEFQAHVAWSIRQDSDVSAVLNLVQETCGGPAGRDAMLAFSDALAAGKGSELPQLAAQFLAAQDRWQGWNALQDAAGIIDDADGRVADAIDAIVDGPLSKILIAAHLVRMGIEANGVSGEWQFPINARALARLRARERVAEQMAEELEEVLYA